MSASTPTETTLRSLILNAGADDNISLAARGWAQALLTKGVSSDEILRDAEAATTGLGFGGYHALIAVRGVLGLEPLDH